MHTTEIISNLHNVQAYYIQKNWICQALFLCYFEKIFYVIVFANENMIEKQFAKNDRETVCEKEVAIFLLQ